MKYPTILALTLATVFLAACGGGGGSSPASGVAPSAITDLAVSGTAATGRAIAGATVTAKCQAGTGTSTTAVDGGYSLVIAGGKLPCVLQITNPADGSKLHTLVAGSSTSAIANITPLTEMVTARTLRNEPAVFFTTFDAAVAASSITTATVRAGQTDVGAVLSGTVDTSALADFIATSLKAATQDNPTGGDAQDRMLDALKVKISGAQLTQIVMALAQTSSTATIRQVVADLTAAPPVAQAGVAQNVSTGTMVTLDGSASSADVGRALTYAWTLTSKPAGSSATLVSPTSATPTFIADIAGTYVATVVVNDGNVTSGAAAVTVSASVANVAPVANAGVAQNVLAGTVVTLDGSASSDANSDPLSYAWTLTGKPAGSAATLVSPTSAKPTFNADVAGTYVATVVVNDGKVNSNAATVVVTAAVLNVAPVASAGVAQNVVAGTLVTLNGSASSDANGDPLNYVWTLTAKPAGSAATLASSTSAKPTFTADVAGTYVATVVVNDGKVSSVPAAVSVNATVANAAPVANAGAAKNVVSGQVVFLDGSASTDANGDTLTYAWTLTSKPIGSPATLLNSTSVAPSFIATGAGTYVAALVVNDGKISSVAATVTVTASVANAAPVANAGVAQNVMLGSLVTLNGSASSDANGDPLTYAWALTTKPTGSTAVLAASNSVSPTFVADLAGTYVAGLTVNDGKVNSSAASVTVTALGAPYANAGSGAAVFDLPANVTRVRIQGTFNGRGANFIIRIANNLVVNALIGTDYAVTFDGTYLVAGGSVVQITSATGVSWSFTEVR